MNLKFQLLHLNLLFLKSRLNLKFHLFDLILMYLLLRLNLQYLNFRLNQKILKYLMFVKHHLYQQHH